MLENKTILPTALPAEVSPPYLGKILFLYAASELFHKVEQNFKDSFKVRICESRSNECIYDLESLASFYNCSKVKTFNKDNICKVYIAFNFKLFAACKSSF